MRGKAPEDRIAAGKTYAGIGENLRRHMPFFRRHGKKGALGAGFILLSALMAFPMPLVSRYVIDDVILGRQLSLPTTDITLNFQAVVGATYAGNAADTYTDTVVLTITP